MGGMDRKEFLRTSALYLAAARLAVLAPSHYEAKSAGGGTAARPSATPA